MRRFWNKIKAVRSRCLTIARSPGFWIVVWVIFVLIAAAVLSINYWCWLIAGESGSTTIRNLGLVLAAVIGLPIAIWRSVVAERQAATAQRSLMNERYQKGAEMLGSEVLSVRLGGVYALARLAREHPGDYHLQIMSLLCSFVRNPPVVGTHDTGLREDVQEVMTEVGSRSEAQIEIERGTLTTLDLSGADLEGLNLLAATYRNFGAGSKTANLERADLIGTNLTSAKLDYANLKGALLVRTNLTGAFLHYTNLTRVVLKDCQGLIQMQIDLAAAVPDDPPNLEDAVDANTGKPLVWRGKPFT